MTVLKVLRLQLFALLSKLLYTLLKLDFESIGSLDLIVAPLIVHDSLIAIKAFL